jgi:hypothetical protein
LEQEPNESYGGIEMKVNLTKLLETSTRTTRQPKEGDVVNKTSALTVVSNYRSTSSERAYSFELEKETFSLER